MGGLEADRSYGHIYRVFSRKQKLMCLVSGLPLMLYTCQLSARGNRAISVRRRGQFMRNTLARKVNECYAQRYYQWLSCGVFKSCNT